MLYCANEKYLISFVCLFVFSCILMQEMAQIHEISPEIYQATWWVHTSLSWEWSESSQSEVAEAKVFHSNGRRLNERYYRLRDIGGFKPYMVGLCFSGHARFFQSLAGKASGYLLKTRFCSLISVCPPGNSLFKIQTRKLLNLVRTYRKFAVGDWKEKEAWSMANWRGWKRTICCSFFSRRKTNEYIFPEHQ